MPREKTYLTQPETDALAIVVNAVDKDVERGEDILMLGFGIVMLSSMAAPIAPPTIVLPAVALVFAVSATLAMLNSSAIEQKLTASLPLLTPRDRLKLAPILTVFKERPMPSLADSFNLLKNVKRTINSIIGGLLINPFWMPIFYVMSMQISEEKNLIQLNKAVFAVEQKHLKSFE